MVLCKSLDCEISSLFYSPFEISWSPPSLPLFFRVVKVSFILRAVFIRRKYGNKQLSSSIFLSEAEPFLEQYAKRSPQNQALIGATGNLVNAEGILAIIDGGRDEEGDLVSEREVGQSSPGLQAKDSVAKSEGLIVFFPGKSLPFGLRASWKLYNLLWNQFLHW